MPQRSGSVVLQPGTGTPGEPTEARGQGLGLSTLTEKQNHVVLSSRLMGSVSEMNTLPSRRTATVTEPLLRGRHCSRASE